MYMQRISLLDFRNYSDISLDLGPGCFILAGDNAQGKSNFCEAAAMLSSMRSFRASSERELIRWGSAGGFAKIQASFQRAQDSCGVSIVISETKPAILPQSAAVPLDEQLSAGSARKKVWLNDAPKRALDCVGAVKVILFEPADLDIVSGAPSIRRHFLDVTLCLQSRKYCKNLSQYQRILTQRAALLKRIREGMDSAGSLTYWDEQLALHACAITAERAAFVARCLPYAEEFGWKMGIAALKPEYIPSFLAEDTVHGNQLFLEQLTRLRKREIAQGVNLLGSHRDDLMFLSETISLGVYGSRGQQRIAALALKLAELRVMEDIDGDRPILALDDVLSELDTTRRKALLNHVKNYTQVFLATAEPEALPDDFIQSAVRLRVSQGNIRQW